MTWDGSNLNVVGHATTTGSFWQGFGGGWGNIASNYLSLVDYEFTGAFSGEKALLFTRQ